MKDSLYPDFLDNKATYQAAQAYWSGFFASLLELEGLSTSPYLDLADDFDGNPVFAFQVPTLNRAIRIIQNSPEETDDLVFTAWLDQITLQADHPLAELVISLVLTKETSVKVVKLTQQWLLKNIPKLEMEALLDKREVWIR